ncbi:CACTA en-spm transposon protein [Cucumis melo var. makuwa]|uniref:CACTA en-spm transposon protein n=1 Tax=Cucumis melo var. makuwa TaxID=1194695 RepID=A0A5A7SXB9_CUCMM|nr:CACTA en-spm transposon protein [Cucumis melo var. makuwa]
MPKNVGGSEKYVGKGSPDAVFPDVIHGVGKACTALGKPPPTGFTALKWSIPDVEKDVGIKNVGNKVFDAINTASEEASGKHSFSTHHEGVGKYSSGKGGFPDVATLRREISFLIISVMYFTESKPIGEKRGEAESRFRFRRPSAAVLLPSVAAVHRHCPSPPSATLAIMSYGRSNFMETDDMFLQFQDDLDNIAGGSSSVGDNTGSSSQQTTPTPRRRVQSRLLELERHVAINGRIPMTIEITKH